MDSISKSERFQTNEKAYLEVYGKSGEGTAEIKNLSKTGACLEWDAKSIKLETGDFVRLTFDLKSVQKKRHVNAKVIWNKGQTSGIVFVRPEELIEKLTLKS